MIEASLQTDLIPPQHLLNFEMFPSKALLSIVLIALSAVDASPLRREVAPTLNFAARVNARANNDLNIAAADRARAQAMQQLGKTTSKRDSGSSFSINNAVVSYTAQVGVGSPATQCKTCHRVIPDIFD